METTSAINTTNQFSHHTFRVGMILSVGLKKHHISIMPDVSVGEAVVVEAAVNCRRDV